MALENYRITEFQEKTQVDNGDYVLIDSATDGTHKYQLSRIPAQASAEVDAAVAAEKAQRQAADAELAGDIGTLSSGKVDKVAGKGLSTNDFTDALKTKLDGIEAGAEVNDVTSVAGKTGAVTLGGGDVSYSDETTYAEGTVGAAISGLKSDLTQIEEELSHISGLSDETKDALLACFAHVEWIDEYGQNYYDALAEALYPDRPEPSFSYGVYEPESIVNGKYINDQGAVVDGEANKSYYIEDYIPVIRASYWLGYQPPKIVQQPYGGSTIARSISNWRVSEYDVSKNFIKQTQFSVSSPNLQYSSSIIVFDSSTKYIRLGWYDTDGEVHEFDIENPASLTALPMEVGDINVSTGQDGENYLRIRTVGYLEVANESLTFTGCPFAPSWPEFETSSGNRSGFYVARCYDASKNFLGSTAVLKDNAVNEALPSGTKYVRFIMTYGLIDFSEFEYLTSYPITINGTRYYVTKSSS